MRFAAVYARAGFRVVPIHDVTSGACSCGQSTCTRSQGKHPRPKNWQLEATTDADQIAEWIRRYPHGNIGLASGAEFFALDVDPKNGGLATLAALVEIHGDLPETPQQTTGSGGSHYLFQPIAGISNRASTLRGADGKPLLGLDVRGDGGQIVVAPSVSLAGAYAWLPGRAPWEIPLAPAPEWLVQMLRAPAPTSTRLGASTEDRGFFPAASADVLESAALALEIHGPAVENSGGDTHTFRAGAILTHDYALTEEEAWPLLWEWNTTCQPPWTAEDLIVKLRNGAEHGKGEFGRCRSMDAVETARKLIVDWQSVTEPDDASLWELIARCRKLAAISGDPAKREIILRELRGATGLGATGLALPKPTRINADAVPAGAIVVGPKLAELADAALKAIAPHVFARSGVLCEVVAGDRAGGTFISDLETPRVQDLMSRSAKWVRTDDKGTVEQAAPLPVASILHSRRAHAGVRVLEAVTTAPVFLADGSILSERGYNAEARLHLEPSVSVDVHDEPTLEHARHAVVVLNDLVGEYRFATPADRSAWLAGVLSPLVKSATANAPAPLFLVSASSAGVGKTMLVQLAALIVTGAEVGVTTYNPRESGEWAKKLTALVQDGGPIGVFDNLDGSIGDEGIDRLLTSTTWKERILGASKAPPLPIVTTWWGSGNNTEPVRDTVRRVLPIRLETNSERPQEEVFNRANLKAYAMQYRSTYLSAALTILRAFHVAGRPDQRIPTWGSFETWSELVRGALVWAGCVDPFATQARASRELHEPENTAHDFWIDVVARCPTGTPEAVAATANTRVPSAQEVLGAREQFTAHSLPKFIGKFIDRPRQRRRIRRHSDPLRYSIEAIR